MGTGNEAGDTHVADADADNGCDGGNAGAQPHPFMPCNTLPSAPTQDTLLKREAGGADAGADGVDQARTYAGATTVGTYALIIVISLCVVSDVQRMHEINQHNHFVEKKHAVRILSAGPVTMFNQLGFNYNGINEFNYMVFGEAGKPFVLKCFEY